MQHAIIDAISYGFDRNVAAHRRDPSGTVVVSLSPVLVIYLFASIRSYIIM